MKSKIIVPFVCLAGFVAVMPVMAKDPPGKGGHKWESDAGDEDRNGGEHKHGPAQERDRVGKHWAFSDEERQAIQGYAERYGATPGKHERRLPPGLARKVARGGKLPPGWEEKCVPGEVLRPEVYQECHPLPPELVVKLPPAPDLTVTVAVEGKVLRLLQATHEILDVFNINVRL
jgi:hypothetical protein